MSNIEIEEHKKKLLSLMKINKLDIEFTEQKIDFEKIMRKMSIQILILGMICLFFYCLTFNFKKNGSMDFLDIIIICFLVSTLVCQIRNILFSNMNLESLYLELEYKEEKLIKLNQELKRL